MDKSNVNMLKVVSVLRTIYKDSLLGTEIEEREIMWGKILFICSKYGINPDLIQMEEFAYREMTIPVFEYYITRTQEGKAL